MTILPLPDVYRICVILFFFVRIVTHIYVLLFTHTRIISDSKEAYIYYVMVLRFAYSFTLDYLSTP